MKTNMTKGTKEKQPPGELKTFIFGDYDPYIEGLKPSFFMVLGSKGMNEDIFPI